MASKETTKPAPSRSWASVYWEQSRRPLAALAFVVPLLVLYEGGVVLLGPQAVRNGADVWLRQVLDLLGFGQYFLLPALTVGLLLGWHHVTHQRWQLSVGVLYVMFAECAVLGLALVCLSHLAGALAAGTLVGRQAEGTVQLAIAWLVAGRGAVVGRCLGFVGAGVYEEMLFRLMLLPPVSACAAWLGAARRVHRRRDLADERAILGGALRGPARRVVRGVQFLVSLRGRCILRRVVRLSRFRRGGRARTRCTNHGQLC